MFLLFTPYSFLFISIYILLLFSLITIPNFYLFWVIIELIILLFIGLSYTIFTSSYSQLMTYFLIQVFSSFMILIFFLYDSYFLLTVSFMLKLSIFPFFSWYLNVVYRFPNLIFWLARTFHKIPAMLIIHIFTLPLNTVVLWLSIAFTTLVSGLIMLSVTDFRLILILSSVGNNSWFLLSQILGVFYLLLFISVYSISLYFILANIKEMSKYSYQQSLYQKEYVLRFWVLSLSGLPPFPIFFVKMLILFGLMSSLGFSYFLVLFLIFNSFIIIGYLQAVIKYFMVFYSSYVRYLLKY